MNTTLCSYLITIELPLVKENVSLMRSNNNLVQYNRRATTIVDAVPHAPGLNVRNVVAGTRRPRMYLGPQSDPTSHNRNNTTKYTECCQLKSKREVALLLQCGSVAIRSEVQFKINTHRERVFPSIRRKTNQFYYTRRIWAIDLCKRHSLHGLVTVITNQFDTMLSVQEHIVQQKHQSRYRRLQQLCTRNRQGVFQ
jgi:hypothetical protein